MVHNMDGYKISFMYLINSILSQIRKKKQFIAEMCAAHINVVSIAWSILKVTHLTKPDNFVK
jgi:hypothetical protein